ncbi:hypothetical protein HPP92_015783 [Vanilla planifolia]|uniref:Uncharacterized protein n=1 Tax=Vanilla planifolia TaxID=51239 RepID=A0A835QP12_VANPL|nr:hypothetical protein HPP92_015783 [Vanilla planifolia]
MKAKKHFSCRGSFRRFTAAACRAVAAGTPVEPDGLTVANPSRSIRLIDPQHRDTQATPDDQRHGRDYRVSRLFSPGTRAVVLPHSPAFRRKKKLLLCFWLTWASLPSTILSLSTHNPDSDGGPGTSETSKHAAPTNLRFPSFSPIDFVSPSTECEDSGNRFFLIIKSTCIFLWLAHQILYKKLVCKMAKGAKSRRRLSSRQFRSTPYPLPRPYSWEASPVNLQKTLALESKDWEEAKCSVCMEFPHHAVLLLCSSYEKGCRPYMCGTSFRHSNCLDQFKKAYTKVRSIEQSNDLRPVGLSSGKSEVLELACPLCRGQVKGWTVVEPARKYLNKKTRNCMQDGCCFVGSYKELKRHVRNEHPCAKPREVDPEMEEKWRVLEHEREREDVLSTIRSSMPGSVVFGDYVIDMTNSDVDGEDDIGGASRGISRSILYFFLREGARLMRLQRGQDDHAGDAVDVSAAYSSGGEDGNADADYNRGRQAGAFRSDRRHRRRRRRSGGASALDVS